MPSRDEALRLLREHRRTLAERFGIVEIALFGSTARDEATERSDVDLLAKFDRPSSSIRSLEAQSYLESVFGRSVDLATEEVLRSELRPYVEEDIVKGPISDVGRRGKDWTIYARDMIRFGETALEYTSGMERAELFADRLRYDATLRNIELIGEAATHIPDEVRAANPDIDWGGIIGARNRIVHGYLSIDEDTVWDIIRRRIPELLPMLRRMNE